MKMSAHLFHEEGEALLQVGHVVQNERKGEVDLTDGKRRDVLVISCALVGLTGGGGWVSKVSCFRPSFLAF